MQKIEIPASKVIEITGGELIGSPSSVFNGLNRIEHASANEISFVSSEKYLSLLERSQAGLVIISKSLLPQNSDKQAFIICDNPYEAFIRLVIYVDKLRFNHPKKLFGIDKNANISVSAVIQEDVYIGAGAFIDDNVVIKSGAKIYSNVSIAKNCIIGKNTILYPGVRVYYNSVIGENCIIHANSVIGSDGFGYVNMPDGSYTKIPQIGNVIIEDNCEIGACTTIDRAVVGSTVIGKGTIIDNLVQIAHNVEIGENSAFASQAGVAGSTKIGKRVKMGGQAGTAGHISIADNVTILAKGGVAQSIEKKGEYFGAPVKPKRDAFRIEAVIPKLPDIYKEMKRLRDEIELLKSQK